MSFYLHCAVHVGNVVSPNPLNRKAEYSVLQHLGGAAISCYDEQKRRNELSATAVGAVYASTALMHNTTHAAHLLYTYMRVCLCTCREQDPLLEKNWNKDRHGDLKSSEFDEWKMQYVPCLCVGFGIMHSKVDG